jgi:signal transduction histidine kinase
VPPTLSVALPLFPGTDHPLRSLSQFQWFVRTMVEHDPASNGSCVCGYVAQPRILKYEKLAVAGRLSASIAHEVNNPLEAATNLLYLLRNGTLDQQQTGYLDEAIQQVRSVSQVARPTLKFSGSSIRNASCKPSE